jgi:isopentenyldiphosphate isomerase
MINKLYTTEYDGDFRLNNEAMEIPFFDKKQIINMIDNEKDTFTPWSIELLNYYFGRPSKIIPITQKFII